MTRVTFAPLLVVIASTTACGGKDNDGAPGGNAGTLGSEDAGMSTSSAFGGGSPTSDGSSTAGAAGMNSSGTSAGGAGGTGESGTGAGGAGGAGGGAQVADAGTCVPTPPPACQSNNWPFCAPDWATAESWYPSCPPEFLDQPYLARCGDYDAIVIPGSFVSRRYFYDARGKLVGFDGVTAGSEHHCSAYSPSFVTPPLACTPARAGCPDAAPMASSVDAGDFGWDGGTPDCATGQAAYDAYLAAQLAQFNFCTMDPMCLAVGGAGAVPLANPCVQPCNLSLPVVALNDQIIARLDHYGQAACARCAESPPPACPPTPPIARCVGGKCVAGIP